MRVIFKKSLFFLLDALLSLAPVARSYCPSKDSNIVVLMLKPLGIGDLVMLSPILILLREKFSQSNICLVTEYEEFIIADGVNWIHPRELSPSLLRNSLVISPSFTFKHLRYMFRSKYFLGYFSSNRLVSNFSKTQHKYSFTCEHYFEKVFPILDVLCIEYNRDKLPYPKINTGEFNQNYRDAIVLAPYSNWPERQFPVEKYVDFIYLLLKYCDNDIVLIGSGSLSEISFNAQLGRLVHNSRVHDLTGRTSITQMCGLIAQARCYIGNDSGPSHIAYVLARKVLVFFGSVRYQDRIPLSSRLREKIQCIDSREECGRFPCYDGLAKPNCINSQRYSCISNIDINTINVKGFLE